MWFAFNPAGTVKNNREHAMTQFATAAEVFYNDELQRPKYMYNKTGEGLYDPQPYAIE